MNLRNVLQLSMDKLPAKTNAERQKAWRERNPEASKKIVQTYVEKNREVMRQRGRTSRAKREGREWEIYTESDVLRIYGTNCYLCLEPIDLSVSRRLGAPGWKLGLQIDHVIPVSKGGGDTLANVRPSHGWCNASKHDKIL